MAPKYKEYKEPNPSQEDSLAVIFHRVAEDSSLGPQEKKPLVCPDQGLFLLLCLSRLIYPVGVRCRQRKN